MAGTSIEKALVERGGEEEGKSASKARKLAIELGM